MSDTYTAYEHAKNNQAEIERSSTDACFGCYATFAAVEVTRCINGIASAHRELAGRLAQTP
ncbi:hypothetical protein [Pseudomonas gingeri]|uniref:hypothetical protein n=1 Tax=Pseudomonas gingeri TaxID=117681 RepID=UPI0015A2A70E|nr:hypothetical protein [Pseudomonas gingeri]NWA05390.1 hypothetical protein [Pseudomonas gingeri]NWA17813.1 hypothetical protein [Pseudomonas gingeri]NWA57777.1 hypothetical protein [Pseudomonas gingeri]NWA98798.1 hypothetical protein [Pseudomonas gingeri]NWB05924.1 hypothetical protein [Pseudomonas gingeri]